MTWHVRVIPNRYADSVRLMGISRGVRERSGVERCEVGMGTPANLELLAGLGASAHATPADLVIAVEASNGVARAETERARSLAAAAREPAGANVASISGDRRLASAEVN